MFRPHLFSVAALALTSLAAPASVVAFGRPQAERSGTRQAAAQLVDGQIQLGLTETKPVFEKYLTTQVIEEGGQKVPKTLWKQRVTMLPECSLTMAPLEEVRAYNMDRKKLSSAELANKLTKPTAVLICPDDQKIDAAYARLVKSDTLVLLVPRRIIPIPDFAAMPMMSPPALPTPIDQGSYVPPSERAPAPASGAAPPPAATAPAPAIAPSLVTPRSDRLGPVAAQAPASAPAEPASDTAAAGLPAPAAMPAVMEQAPAGTQPVAGFARLSDGKLRLRRTLITNVQSTAYQTTGEGEAQQISAVSVKRTGRVEIVEEFDPQAVQAFARDGQEVAAADLTTRLAEEVAVLASADGQPIDKGYLNLLKDDTLVLIVPVEQPPSPSYAMHSTP